MTTRITPIVLPATPETLGMLLHGLRDYVSRAGHIAGLSQRSIYNLKLAVDEIATNIVVYGYKNTQYETIITATAVIQPDRVIVTLEDNAIEFDPRAYQLPVNFDEPLETRELGGLGIYLALTSVDVYSYDYIAGCNRNQFSMLRPEEARQAILPYRVLLFDGLTHSPESLAGVLTRIHYPVVAAGDREMIFEQLCSDEYDVLVMGDHVPHDDVVWILKHLRMLPITPDTLVLIASSDSAHIIRCLELGATDYIHTPVAPNFLSWRMDKMLQTSTARLRQRIAKLSRHIKQILLSDDTNLRFGKDLNFEHYLEEFLIEVQGIYNADAGTVYIRTENDSLRFAIVRTASLGIALGGTSGQEIDFPLIPLYDRQSGEANHHNVATHVALTGTTVNIDDIYTNEDFDFSGTRWFDKHTHYRSISTLTVPLRDYSNYVIGVVQLINAQDEQGRIIPFDDSEQMIVEALCAHTAVILSNHRLLKKQETLARIENDIKIGRQIQRDFMPAHIPEKEGWQIAARFFPAREVAGDFYDLFELNGYLVLVIADVCDKGVGAALFMALIRSLIRAFTAQAREQILALPYGERTEHVFERHLKRVVESTNDYILEHHYELNMFATLFAGLLNTTTGELIYINGGHTPAPLLMSRDGDKVERLGPTGPAVGMFEDAAFFVEHTRLAAHDMLVALTDGVTDIQNAQGQPLGIQALLDMFSSSEWENVDGLMTQLEDMLVNFRGDFKQFDDMTFWMVYRDIE